MGNWFGGALGFGAGLVGGFTLFLLVVWTIIWKGMALWKSAQRKEKVWFIVLLVVNTLGILEILYLYVFSREKK
jgi:methionyl-tRNA synthetase